jgi:Ca2+-binding EF-hand superfamily protein
MSGFISVLAFSTLLTTATEPAPRTRAVAVGNPRTSKLRADAFIAGQSLDGVTVVQHNHPPFTLNAAATTPDAVRIYFLAQRRPLTIRIQLKLDNQPIRELWPKLLRSLFNTFDRDRDGYLNRFELERTFPTKNMSAMLSGSHFMRGPDSVIVFEQLDRDHDNRISFDELAAYYAQAGQDIVSTINANANAANQAKIENDTTEKLFLRMDANSDGKITREEIRQAERLFEQHDENDDETLSYGELQLPTPNATPNNVRSGRNEDAINTIAPSTTTASDVFVVMGDAIPDALRARWQAKYPNRAITSEPDFVGETNIASNENRALRITPARGTIPEGCELRTSQPSRIVIRVDQQFVDVSVAAVTIRGKATDELRDSFPSEAKKPLTEDDLSTNPYLRVVFDDVDFDNDGRIAKHEFDRFLALQQSVIDTALAVASRVQTPNLFQLLDGDGDERLSLRELRTAIDRLRVLEDGSPEFVTRAALRPSAQVSFTKNLTPSTKVFATGGLATSPTATPPQSRPLWFQKMDRNNDGDVSRREFLGTLERFHEIDRDHDGLISLQEIEAFLKKK